MKNLNFIKYYKNFVYGNNIPKNDIIRLLSEEKIVIADIGSTGGLDARWFFLEGYIKKYSFDPDSRAENIDDDLELVFNLGLWSSEVQKEIFLTRFPSASSVFPPNANFLCRFLNHKCHDILGSAQIKMARLDSVIQNNSPLDFIKVDTEGSDLEILYGASKAIKTTVIGIQVEAQFVERNQGSPMFSDLDPVIRGDGYWLMELKRQSWIRNNDLNNIDTIPQLIWADAIYMITENEALKRANDMYSSRRFEYLSKIVLISIAYGYIDYAMEILQSFFNNNLISRDEMNMIKEVIDKNLRSNLIILFHLFIALLIALIGYLIGKVFNIKKEFFKYHLWYCYKKFFEGLTKLHSRHGPNNVAIGDGF
jgi:FkbM family methyltransferase